MTSKRLLMKATFRRPALTARPITDQSKRVDEGAFRLCRARGERSANGPASQLVTSLLRVAQTEVTSDPEKYAMVAAS